MACITFVVPVGDEGVLNQCLLSSRIFRSKTSHQLLLQRGWRSASGAFNDAIDKAHNDIIVCLHQDIILPESWTERLVSELAWLETNHPSVGIVGCAGITNDGKAAGHIYRHNREFHPGVPLPSPVQTLDEMLICFRKSSGLRFDDQLPSFFGYAVDLCLTATSRGLRNFAIDAPCFHQAKSRQGRMPEQFFVNWNYLCEKWKPLLPVNTLTGVLHHKQSFFLHKLKQFMKERVGYSPEPWWHELPIIDTDYVLHADSTGSQDGLRS